MEVITKQMVNLQNIKSKKVGELVGAEMDKNKRMARRFAELFANKHKNENIYRFNNFTQQ